MLGTSVGDGIVVYTIAQSELGLSRSVIGRSTFLHAASPSFLNGAMASLNYIVVVEQPLFFDLKKMMGLVPYDSDDDDESTNAHTSYCLDWRPQVCRGHTGLGSGLGISSLPGAFVFCDAPLTMLGRLAAAGGGRVTWAPTDEGRIILMPPRRCLVPTPQASPDGCYVAYSPWAIYYKNEPSGIKSTKLGRSTNSHTHNLY